MQRKKQVNIGKLASVFFVVALMTLIGIHGQNAAHAQAAPRFDHLKCYTVLDRFDVPSSVELLPFQEQFSREKCKILDTGRKLVCIPVSKVDVTPDPGIDDPTADLPIDFVADRICYLVQCEGDTPKELQIADQFGSRVVRDFRPFLFCTPAIKVVCGDGFQTPPEECDPAISPECMDASGNIVGLCDTETCRCEPIPANPVCGDRLVQGDEECDPPGTACAMDSTIGTCTAACECGPVIVE